MSARNRYKANPLGSYQGYFDRPITTEVYIGSQPLSFSDYTDFSQTQECNEYSIYRDRYIKLDDLEKVDSLTMELC